MRLVLQRLREPSSKAGLAVLLSLAVPTELAGPVVDGLVALLALWAIVTPEAAGHE